MPGGWTLVWGEDHRAVAVDGPARLDELLAEAAQDAQTSHTVAELVSPSGAELTIGLGQERSIVTFKASPDPPYFVSLGTGSIHERLVFYYGGAWSEFGGEEAITLTDAMAALKEFYETGERPSCIAWREV
jgi:hypothetical protein